MISYEKKHYITYTVLTSSLLARIQAITVAVLSKARTVFSSPNAGIVGSNPTQGMDICLRLFCVYVVLYAGSDLATVWSPVKKSPTDCV
jgi:hypothetical protein